MTVSMQVTTDTCRTRRLLWYENVFDCGTSSPPCATVCEPRMAVPAGEWVSAAGLCMHAVRPAQRRAPSCSASLPPRSACRRRRAAHTWSAPRPRRRTSTRRTACVPPAAPAVCKPRRTPSACAGRVPATYWLLMSGHVVSAPPDYPMTSKNEASGAMFRSAAAKLRACRSALLREAPRRCVPHLPCVGGQQNRSAPLRRLPQSAAGSKRARDAPQHCLTPGRRPRQEAAQEGATAAPPADEPVLLHFVALVEHEGRCGQSPQRGRGRDAACASGLRASL